jgi:hypothetical protein
MCYPNGTGLIAEEFLRLRHAMIPYIYSAMIRTHEEGRALIEPMYYEYPDAKEAYECPNQYMFGSELLVSPIVTPGDSKKMAKTRVWLPEGTWTDIFTGDVYSGGRWVDMVRFMDSIPVLAKDGAFVPLDARKHTNNADIPDKLRVMVFNGNGEYTLFEDEENTRFVSKSDNGKQTVLFEATEKSIERGITLEFRNIKDGKVSVLADGKPIYAEVRGDDFVIVKIDSALPGVIYVVEVEFEEDAKRHRNDRFLYALTRMEIETKLQRWIWKLHDIDDDKELIRQLFTYPGLTENERIRLTEAL